jgi:hypothetical protein
MYEIISCNTNNSQENVKMPTEIEVQSVDHTAISFAVSSNRVDISVNKS